MSKRYGFIYVDKDDEGNGTLKRIKKDSFAAYRHIIETNGAELWFPLASPPALPQTGLLLSGALSVSMHCSLLLFILHLVSKTFQAYNFWPFMLSI